MSGSPKMTKRFPLPVFFRSSDMCRSAFIRAFSTGIRPSLLNSVAWRLVVESAGDQHIKVGIARFARGLHQIGPRDGAELWADEDGGALFGSRFRVAFDVAPFCADEVARPRREGGESDLVFLVRLLHAGSLEVLQDHLGETSASRRIRRRLASVDRSIRRSHPRQGRDAATGFRR